MQAVAVALYIYRIGLLEFAAFANNNFVAIAPESNPQIVALHRLWNDNGVVSLSPAIYMDIIIFPCTIPKINILVTEFKERVLSFYPPIKVFFTFLSICCSFWMGYILYAGMVMPCFCS